VSGLSGLFPLADLLEAAQLPKSSYYYALSHPKAPTRPELRDAVAGIFARTANGRGHRQVAMCLRAEREAVIADKTVLKMMREMGLRCGMRRETDYHRYNSYKGVVGETFENVIGRDFAADGPWQKMGTDVTEFKQPWGKAHFAPVYDFGSKEIVAWSTSRHPDMAQQGELLDMLIAKKPDGARPVPHSDMGWQYQHAKWVKGLKGAGIVQSMSRKGNCIDNGATEQVFGHLKDEFFRGRTWPDFESFKADLDAYVVHWNTRRGQVRLKGLTPEEFRNQSLCAA
jgi:putative transposase